MSPQELEPHHASLFMALNSSNTLSKDENVSMLTVTKNIGPQLISLSILLHINASYEEDHTSMPTSTSTFLPIHVAA